MFTCQSNLAYVLRLTPNLHIKKLWQCSSHLYDWNWGNTLYSTTRLKIQAPVLDMPKNGMWTLEHLGLKCNIFFSPWEWSLLSCADGDLSSCTNCKNAAPPYGHWNPNSKMLTLRDLVLFGFNFFESCKVVFWFDGKEEQSAQISSLTRQCLIFQFKLWRRGK